MILVCITIISGLIVTELVEEIVIIIVDQFRE